MAWNALLVITCVALIHVSAQIRTKQDIVTHVNVDSQNHVDLPDNDIGSSVPQSLPKTNSGRNRGGGVSRQLFSGTSSSTRSDGHRRGASRRKSGVNRSEHRDPSPRGSGTTPEQQEGSAGAGRTSNPSSSSTIPRNAYPFKFQGSALQHHAQQMIANVNYFFEVSQKNPSVLIAGSSKELVARATNVGYKAVIRIMRTDKQVTPGKKRNYPNRVQNLVDDFDRDMIHRIIKNFYLNNKPPFFKDIYETYLKQRRENEASKATPQGQGTDQLSLEEQTPTSNTPETSPGGQGAVDLTLTPQRPDQTLKPFTICKDTFRKVLYSLGYKYGRVKDRLALVQRNDIVAWRRKYLRIMKRNRASAQPKEVWFLDETWLDKNGRYGRGWVPKSCPSFKLYKDFTFAKNAVGKGPRLVVIGVASSKTGLLKELTKVYKIKKSDVKDDYHSNVNGVVFTRYMTEMLEYLKTRDDQLLIKEREEAGGLLQGLTDEEKENKKSRNPILIVMDNAPYHTVDNLPKQGDRKDKILIWLKDQQAKGEAVFPEEDMLKPELWDLVKQLKKLYNYYTIDSLVAEYGHQVVRLPPYNCDLNPIEFVWSNIKTAVKKENRLQTLDSVEALAKATIQNYKLEAWQANYRHALNLEQKYWDDDGIIEERIIELQIQFNEDDLDDEAVFPDAPQRVFDRYRGIADMDDFEALGLSSLLESEAAEVADSNDEMCDEALDSEPGPSKRHRAQ